MKKSNRNILLLLAGIIGGIGLFFLLRTPGDSDDSDDNTEEDHEMTTKVGAVDLLEGVKAKETETVKDFPESFLLSNANFSLELFKELVNEENVVFSPVPVYLSLALISNGAEDEANNEILDTLNLTDLSDEEFNAYYHELVDILDAEDKSADLNISNSIWYDQDFQANADFLQTNKTYYDADSYTLDFSDSNSPGEINNWASEVTNGKIEKMIDEIGPDTVMYLFSAIYFDGKWEVPFSASHTYESEFLIDGEMTEVEKMTGRFDVENIITEEEEGIILPYEDDEYSFLALMPEEGVDVREYLQSFNGDKLIEVYNQIEQGEVEIQLPKFEVSFENKLNEALSQMGINDVFDSKKNSLSKMGEVPGNLFISDMFQKTYIEVNELGTEAASIVGSEIETTSMPEPKPIINFDRPFIYSVIDNETGLPLFLGVMDNPGK